MRDFVAVRSAYTVPPLVYAIDAQNVYHRASLCWVSRVTGLIGMGMIVRYRSAIDARRERRCGCRYSFTDWHC